MLREVVEARRRTLGATHTRTLIAIDGHAVALMQLGRLEEAEALLTSALEAWIERVGEDNYEAARCRGMLGECLLRAGRPEEALFHLGQCLEILSAVDGLGSFETLGHRTFIAEALLATGEHEAAEFEARRAIEDDLRMLDSRHQCFAVVVRSLLRQARLEEARREYDHWRQVEIPLANPANRALCEEVGVELERAER
jgi:tetratricopeptide (TPR) repeat protein